MKKKTLARVDRQTVTPTERATASTDCGVPSAACDAVIAAIHPSPENGGPCATCAFRVGTEANQTWHTMALARLSVEGGRMFHCHERVQLCRGFVAALNLRGAPQDEDDRNWAVVAGHAADMFTQCIDAAVAADAVARDSE